MVCSAKYPQENRSAKRAKYPHGKISTRLAQFPAAPASFFSDPDRDRNYVYRLSFWHLRPDLPYSLSENICQPVALPDGPDRRVALAELFLLLARPAALLRTGPAPGLR